MNNKNISVAIIGKSSSGKSAFIKSFSKWANLISSDGKGQTTRSYVEYKFYISDNEVSPEVYIKLMSEQEFVNKRLDESINKIKSFIVDEEKISFVWLEEQFNDEGYKEDITKSILNSNDFFNIDEFYFLDNGETVEKLEIKYNEFVLIVNAIARNNLDEINFEFNKKEIELIKEIQNRNDGKIVESEKSEFYFIQKLLILLFEDFYNIIIESIMKKFDESNYLIVENGVIKLQFNVTSELKDMLALFLKVVPNKPFNKSLSSVVSQIRINSAICSEYRSILKQVDIESIMLLDTYGLDHAESYSDEILRERYKRIFTRDYPNISYAFFVEALHTGSSNDFVKALNILYSEKPEIMSYIIGTHIDEQEERTLDEFSLWLTTLEKNVDDVPSLNGKVIEHLFQTNNISNNLRRNKVHPTLAKKRLEVMRKRFGPFCGDVRKLEDSFFKKINLVTIESILISIVNQEHLGEEFINIDKISTALEDDEKFIPIMKYMVNYASQRFNEIFLESASRTTGKIRENIEKYILGFDGSTLDATWFRVFNDAYNNTFSKEIDIDGEKSSLSKIFGLVGNERIAFDELINRFFPYLFSKKCENGEKLSFWNHEINCGLCRNKNNFNSECIWGMFINLVRPENFIYTNKYDRVYKWLCDMHNLEEKNKKNNNNEFLIDIKNYFKLKLEKDLIFMCREYNMQIAGKRAKQSNEFYQEEKYRVFKYYKDNFDDNAEIELFFKGMN